MTHRRDPAPDDRTPEWLIGLLIAIVLVTVGWFFLRSVGAGDNPVLVDDGQAEAEPTPEAAFVLHERTPAGEHLAGEVAFIGMNALGADRSAAESLIGQSGVRHRLAEGDLGERISELFGI